MTFSMKPATTRKRLSSLFVLFLVLATAAALTAGGATLAQADGKPARPTGLTAQADQQGVHLSWDSPAGTDITHHRVLRKATETESRFRPVEANTGSAGASYTDATAAAETQYAYRVQAVNSHGKSKRSRGVRITTPAAATEEEAAEPPGPGQVRGRIPGSGRRHGNAPGHRLMDCRGRSGQVPGPAKHRTLGSRRVHGHRPGGRRHLPPGHGHRILHPVLVPGQGRKRRRARPLVRRRGDQDRQATGNAGTARRPHRHRGPTRHGGHLMDRPGRG